MLIPDSYAQIKNKRKGIKSKPDHRLHCSDLLAGEDLERYMLFIGICLPHLSYG
jgi:hypothetical protein